MTNEVNLTRNLKFIPYYCWGIQIILDSLYRYVFILLSLLNFFGGEKKFKILVMFKFKILLCIFFLILPRSITEFYVSIYSASALLGWVILNIVILNFNTNLLTSPKNF